MKEAKYTIQINKPTSIVFEFSTNPSNTPKWIDGITEEKTSEWPVRIGTIYRNRSGKGNWNEYTVTELVQDNVFTLKRNDGDYGVRYIFTPNDDESCELEYHEWVESGELDDTFSQATLEKLKTVIESNTSA